MKRTDQFTFFWGASDPFSNWHPAPFTFRGIQFAQTEQFMMYCKARLFGDTEAAEAILKSPDPKANKAAGRKVRGFVEETWQANARRYVYIGNRAKYLQNPHLLQALIDTAPTRLVEASPYDRIWGIGLKADDPRSLDPTQWQGTNWLGDVLTRLRDDLIEKAGTDIDAILSASRGSHIRSEAWR